MKILSIETSCDETGISVLEAKDGAKVSFKVLANTLSSQTKIHAPYGGVYPMLAKREHIKNLPILLEKALKKSRVKKTDLIAVTSGPGLEPALWTGITFGKDLAEKWKVPLIPVNHMEGHILSVFGKQKGKFSIEKIKFPALSLLISGGHTELVLIKDDLKYKVIGETLDDAAGEAFDKVARMLGLPYPGGPEISKLADRERKNMRRFQLSKFSTTAPFLNPKKVETGPSRIKNYDSLLLNPNSHIFTLPRPMIYTKNFDFSFSGLKTAVLYLIKKIGDLNEDIKAEISMEFENAVVETLVYKTKKASEKYKIKTLIIAGGVSANKYLKKEMKKNIGKEIKVLFPEKKLATDNSIMIGIVGYLQYKKNKGKIKKMANIKAEGNLRL